MALDDHHCDPYVPIASNLGLEVAAVCEDQTRLFGEEVVPVFN